MFTHESDKVIFILPVGYAVTVFGLAAYTFGTFGPALGLEPNRGVAVAAVLAGLIFIGLYHRIAAAIFERWQAGNQYTINRLEHEAGALSARIVADDERAPIADDDDSGRIEVNTVEGSYSLPRLSEAERRQNALIGDCLQFIAIGGRAGSFSLRAMTAQRPVGWSENRFEKWWAAKSDQLVRWGLFEKLDRSGTRPANGRTPDDVRRALLRREFATAGDAGQAGQGQAV